MKKVTCTHTSPTICFTDIPPGYIPPPLPSHDFLRPAPFPFDHTRHTEASTQGASKMRRDSINGEVMKLRDLLPLPPSTRYHLIPPCIYLILYHVPSHSTSWPSHPHTVSFPNPIAAWLFHMLFALVTPWIVVVMIVIDSQSSSFCILFLNDNFSNGLVVQKSHISILPSHQCGADSSQSHQWCR